MDNSFLNLVELCKNRTVWIQTHNFPDPDAISSSMGLQYLLKQYDIQAQICYEGQIDKLSTQKLVKLCKIELYSREEIQDQMSESDLIILVDCQKDTGNTLDMIGQEEAVIDHHPIVNEIQYEFENRRMVGACASLIAEYYKMLELKVPKYVATALIYGIKMDTLQFTRGVTPLDIEMFGFLFPYADQKKVKKLETNTMEYSDLQAYSTTIGNIQAYGRVGISFVNFSCSDGLVAMLSDFILALEEIDVVVIWAIRKNGYKFSFRSERNHVHAGELANSVLSEWGSGGGHATMAGGFAPKKIFADIKTEELRKDVITERILEIINRDYPDMLEP